MTRMFIEQPLASPGSAKKMYLKILMRETCLGFSTLKNFTQIPTLAASGGSKPSCLALLSPKTNFVLV